MQTQRPMFLNLWQINFPVTAIISILHRLSGVFLFLLLPWILTLWHASLLSNASFNAVVANDLHGFGAFLMWLWLTAAVFHMFAGIRHLVMDIGFAEHLSSARKTSYVVIVLSAIASLLIGVWLW